MRHARRVTRVSLGAGAVVSFVLGVGMVPAAVGSEKPAEGVATADRPKIEERSYDLAGHGTLLLMVPESWREEQRRPPAESGVPPMPTIEYRPPQGDALKLLVTVFWGETPDEVFTLEQSRKLMEHARDQVAPKVRETDIPLVDLKGSEARGFYISVTDTAETLPYGEYRHMTQGDVTFGEVTALFTLFRQEGTEDLVGTTLEIIREARLKPPRSKAN